MVRCLKSVLAIVGAILAALFVALATGCIDTAVERRLNTVVARTDAPKPTPREQAFHAGLTVIDLHADTLLWGRDPLVRADYGHVDLPRLVDGHVALQVFSVASKTPLPGRPPAGAVLHPAARRCIDAHGIDTAALLQIAQLRSPALWFDVKGRVFDQASRFADMIAASEARHQADPEQPYFRAIMTGDDVARVIRDRRRGEPVIGALLALEGVHWIDDPEADAAAIQSEIRALHDAGFRMVSPTHRFQNALGGASEGCDQRAGLTPAGKAFVTAVVEAGMVVDIAHLTDRGALQAVTLADGAVVVSHTGLRATCEISAGCDPARNIPDSVVRAVARADGVVGIGFWPQAVGRGIDRIVAAYVHGLRVLSAPEFVAEMRRSRPGYDPAGHLAFGSDFDGAVEAPFHVGQLDVMTAALLRGRDDDGRVVFDPAMVAKIAGGNVWLLIRVLGRSGGAGGPAVCA